MNVWISSPESPRRMRPGERLSVRVGTWPIGPGQKVTVRFRVRHADASSEARLVEARWERNDGVNSTFGAEIGPFAAGDLVTFSAEASDDRVTVQTPDRSLRIGPKIYLALLWHQHQPLYRDTARFELRGSLQQPWVRLHAIRDYYAMAALVAEHPDVHLTINLTPALLAQIADYTERGATDTALELSLKPAEDLTADERERLLSTFFEADWHTQVFIHPRYAELFAQRTHGTAFSTQDLRDLQAWFNLAWFGQEFRDGEVLLATGEVASVRHWVRQARGFELADIRRIVDEQLKVMRAVLPIHRTLQNHGQIEVSTTPYFHPILPLLVDTDRATIDLPGATYPPRFAHPEDAEVQVRRACEEYARPLGQRPRGMWPAEAAVSQSVVPFFAGAGLAWIASDAGVLARSGRWGYEANRPDILCTPYIAEQDGRSIAVFFRDAQLSDAIGFRYAKWQDAGAAAKAFVDEVKDRFAERVTSDDDRVLTVALDGENAWGTYAADGRPFLRALYRALSDDPEIATVTFAEYLDGNAPRGLAPHPSASLPRVYDLFTGSWIDQVGSAPGVDLGTWIGRPEKNRAWALLGQARDRVTGLAVTSISNRAAFDALLAAEGSDWFWWFGEDHTSGLDDEFDRLFRMHLANSYRAIGEEPPRDLDVPVAEHAVIWSLTRPTEAVARGEALIAQTNCPGRLSWSVDDGPWHEADMNPVGGAMAAIERHQVRVGPLVPSAQEVRIRFHCTHSACDCRQPCCRSEVYRVRIGAP